MFQPAAAPLDIKNKDSSLSAPAGSDSSSHPLQTSYPTGSALLDSFSAHSIGGPTTTLLTGQLAGQLIDPSELFCNQSSRVDSASTTARSPSTARTSAVNRLTTVLKSDRASVKPVGQSGSVAQKT